jgi:hypothetical protein
VPPDALLRARHLVERRAPLAPEPVDQRGDPAGELRDPPEPGDGLRPGLLHEGLDRLVGRIVREKHAIGRVGGQVRRVDRAGDEQVQPDPIAERQDVALVHVEQIAQRVEVHGLEAHEHHAPERPGGRADEQLAEERAEPVPADRLGEPPVDRQPAEVGHPLHHPAPGLQRPLALHGLEVHDLAADGRRAELQVHRDVLEQALRLAPPRGVEHDRSPDPQEGAQLARRGHARCALVPVLTGIERPLLLAAQQQEPTVQASFEQDPPRSTVPVPPRPRQAAARYTGTP